MPDFDIRVEVAEGGIGTLSWNGRIEAAALERAVAITADDALLGRGLRRLEVALPGTDRVARRAVMRAGFRLEGVRREAQQLSDGSYGDVSLFARLAADAVHGPTGFSGVMNSALPRKRLIAHVLIRDPDGRALICETQFKSDWELPGGIVEPYESPRLGAIREVSEELGIALAVGRLLVADWMPPYLGWDDALELIFDGGTMSEPDLAGLTLQTTEIRRVEFCTLDRAAEVMTPLAHRRLAIAAGLGPAEIAYTEDGRTLTDNPPLMVRARPERGAGPRRR